MGRNSAPGVGFFNGMLLGSADTNPTHGRAFVARRAIAAASVAVVATLAAVLLGPGTRPAGAAAGNIPNILLIMTDDQASHELSAMGATGARIANQGVTFKRFYANYPLCCPARVSLLTGQMMHNHQVRGNALPNGGWERFRGREPNALPTWLPSYYETVWVGKYMNSYASTFAPHVPAGWDEWYAKTGSTGGVNTENEYYNYSLFEQGGQRCGGPFSANPMLCTYNGASGDYATDVYRDKAVAYLNARPHASVANPFFMVLSFNAPHFPNVAARRHVNLLNGRGLPKLPAFNEKNISDKPRFIRRARFRFTTAERASLAASRRRRLEQLLSVDDAVNRVVATLAARGELSSTYIIFKSDNGFFRGEHRIGSGKYLAHEPSSRIPFVIRGPGIPPNRVSNALASNVDVGPTIAAMAGTGPSIPGGVDGKSILPLARSPSALSARPILLEADVGPGRGTGRFGVDSQPRNRRQRMLARLGLLGAQGVTDLDQEPGLRSPFSMINGNIAPAYKAVVTRRYKFIVYGSGEKELYDLRKDPGEAHSRHRDPRYRGVKRFLFKALVRLSNCRRATCRITIGAEPKPKKRIKKKKRRRGARR